MKFLVAFSAVLALAAARPGYLHAPLAYVAPVAHVVPFSSQYHSQDTLGQYAYGYSAPLSAKSESRSVDGVTNGAYSYVDAEGKVQSVSYTADALNGFRVAGTNIPVAPEVPEVPEQEEPKPVEDTAEVASAKAEHSASVEAIKARDAAIVASDPGDDAVEVGHAVVQVPYVYNYAAPAVHYVQPYSYYNHVPAVYSYNVPYVYTNGHPASDLPHNDEAVAKAASEHEAAHKEVKAKLAAAGAEVH